MRDQELIRRVTSLPQYAPTDVGLDEQLRVLYDAANKLGLYDAADYIRYWGR